MGCHAFLQGSSQAKDRTQVSHIAGRFFTVNPSGFQERVEIITGVYFYRILLVILEKAMAPHSSTLAWKIPWMEEPGRLQSMGSLRVGHD